MAYFEVTILHCAPRCSINVGLADRSHSLNKVLGSDAKYVHNSCLCQSFLVRLDTGEKTAK